MQFRFDFWHTRSQNPFKLATIWEDRLRRNARRPRIRLPHPFFSGTWQEYRDQLKARRPASKKDEPDAALTLQWLPILRLVYRFRLPHPPDGLVLVVGSDGVQLFQMVNQYPDAIPLGAFPPIELDLLLEALYDDFSSMRLPLLAAYPPDVSLGSAIRGIAQERLRRGY